MGEAPLGTPISVIQALDSPEWNADVYGALSSLSRLASALRNKANVLHLAFSLYKLNGALKSLFATVGLAMSGELKLAPGAEVPTPQRLRDSSDKLMKLSRDLEYIYQLLRRVGLTNNSLVGGNLAKLRGYESSIEDLADWFDLMAQSDEVKIIFERASRERDRGEIFDLEHV
jgi:hypothetical protein